MAARCALMDVPGLPRCIRQPERSVPPAITCPPVAADTDCRYRPLQRVALSGDVPPLRERRSDLFGANVLLLDGFQRVGKLNRQGEDDGV
jgi:hypothetical protein